MQSIVKSESNTCYRYETTLERQFYQLSLYAQNTHFYPCPVLPAFALPPHKILIQRLLVIFQLTLPSQRLCAAGRSNLQIGSGLKLIDIQ